MSLLLIRHGETPLNVARVLQPADTPLSDRGRAQAQALAQRLRGEALGQIVCSDLPRARQTAEIVAAACGVAIETTPLLRERDFGDLRGRPYDGLGFDPLTMADAPPGGESIAEFEARCALAWVDLLQRRAGLGAALAVVTHGLVLRAWLRSERIDRGGATPPAVLGNTALSIVEAAPPHRLRLMACTRHLDAAAAHDPGSLSGG